MQCSNCGSHYRMRDLACPYCGTENALGRLWQKQRTEAELSYEKARVAAGKKWSPYIYDRVVSRVMVVEFLLILFTIFVLIVFFSVRSIRGRFSRDMERRLPAAISVMDEMLDAGEYGRFEAYNEQFEDILDDTEEYREYYQMEYLAHYYNQFEMCKFDWLSMDDQHRRDDEYILSALLRYPWLMCSYKDWQHDLQERPRRFIEESRKQFTDFLKAYLNLTETEVNELFSLEYYYSFDDEWEMEVRERNGW